MTDSTPTPGWYVFTDEGRTVLAGPFDTNEEACGATDAFDDEYVVEVAYVNVVGA